MMDALLCPACGAELERRPGAIHECESCVDCDRPHDCWHNGCNKGRQNPVAYLYTRQNSAAVLRFKQESHDPTSVWEIPLYAAPRELSDEEILEISKTMPYADRFDFAKAILKKASER